MTYSCSDFASDVQRCLVHCGALQEEAVAAGEIGDHADACIAAIISLNCAAVAARFTRELLDSVETLGDIAEQFGNEGLVTLLYLQAAILNGSFVEMDTRHAELVAFLKTLPSAGKWMKHVRTIDA